MSSTNNRPSGVFGIVYGIVKTIAIVGGLPLTILGLMALVGLVTDSGWARLIASLVVAIGVPLFIVDRLLPDDNVKSAKGIPTDTVALIWAGFALAYFGAAHGLTRDATVAEADRLARGGYARMARVNYWLASAKPVLPAPATPPPLKKTSETKAPSTQKAATTPKAKSPDAGVAPSDAAIATAPAKRADGGTPKKDGAPTKKARKRTKLTPQELFARFAPSVVSIRCPSSSGTGFVIDDIGTIATNHHVIAKQSSIEIKLKSGRWIGKLDILVEDKKRDLALLRSKVPLKTKALQMGDSDAVKVGERSIAIGNPLGLTHTLTDGVVSARRIYRDQKWVQTSTPVSPGNSGGPLFNMYGEVIGVVTAQIGSLWGRAQNLNLAVPINDLKKMLKDEYPKRRAVGSDAAQSW